MSTTEVSSQFARRASKSRACLNNECTNEIVVFNHCVREFYSLNHEGLNCVC